MILDSLLKQLEELGLKKPERLLRSAVAEIYEEQVSIQEIMDDPEFGGNLNPEQQVLFEKAVRQRAGLDIKTPETGPGISLKREPWLEKLDPYIDWFHWNRYEQVLRNNGLPHPAILNIKDTSKKILTATPRPIQIVEDKCLPSTESFEHWRGLVVGHVQSGKTANFTALICRGADVGYRLFIVLGGMLNALRFQTQIRLSAEILGEPDGPALPNGRKWHKFTSPDMENGDFRESDLSANLQTGSPPSLAVIKKNVSVMQALNSSLEKLAEDEVLRNELTVMVIDDEADEASVNTKSGEAPSSTNVELRTLLNIFPRTSYVGFTATPYANCFIPSDEDHTDFGEDLYPKDYILPLEVGDAYVSSEHVFGREPVFEDDPRQGIPGIFQKIPTEELPKLIPDPGTAPDGTPNWKTFQPEMVSSLRRAVLSFLLAGAARIARGEGDEHATMLINISRHPLQQGWVGPVDDESEDDKGQVKIVKDLIFQVTRRLRGGNGAERLLADLEDIWVADFAPSAKELNRELPPIREVLGLLVEFAQDIQFKVINGDSEDKLDFRRGPKANRRPPVKAIVVGGQALGRGLTLEGLLCTYFTRESGNMATAVQMQRWCGYRKDFLDLMKVYTTGDVKDTYRHAVAVEEEMRHELKKYEAEGLRPNQVSMLLRQHPDVPLTTANKSRGAVPYDGQFAGRIPQTTSFRKASVSANFDHTKRLFESLMQSHEEARTEFPTAVTWSGLSEVVVTEFLAGFRSIQSKRGFNSESLKKYITDQAEQNGHLTSWTIALCGAPTDEQADAWDFGDRKRSRLRMRVGKKSGELQQIGIITDPAHEALDLKDCDKRGAGCRALRAPQKGLLLVYPIRIRGDDAKAIPVVGLAISFSRGLKDGEFNHIIAGGGTT